MIRLSDKKQRMLAFIEGFLREKDYPPSVRDIQKACHISSTSVVDYNLKALERDGYIRRDPEVSRSIVLQTAGRERTTRVPLIGQIAAGSPIPVPTADVWDPAAQAETIEVPVELTQGNSEVYALRVQGVSMVDALINDGDIVLMQQASTAENGEMVAAWLKAEGEVTLKRFYREPRRIRLQPANIHMRPIYTRSENVEIQGKVVGVLRRI